MNRLVTLSLTLLLAVATLGCEESAVGTIVDVAAADGRFTVLVGALESTGLDETLDGEGPFTVFAPTDEAFGLLPSGLVASLDTATLSQVLLYHVVPGRVGSEEVVALTEALTAADLTVKIQVDDGTVVLDGRVQITFTDIHADNGIIHVIDAVLVPGEFPGTVVDVLAASPRFSTLVGAVAGEGLDTLLSGTNGGAGFTVFAPTNAAFGRLPSGLVASLAGSGLDNVLAYHVLSGEVDASGAAAAAGMDVDTLATDAMNGDAPFAVGIDDATGGRLFLDGRTQITSVDIEASNGIVHVLDSVLVPGGDFPGTLVETLQAYPRFSSLVAAVVAEGLVGAVTGVTVFAPTNDAFAAADLTGQDVGDVLLYHVLAGSVGSGSLGSSQETALGPDVTISYPSGVVINGTANVIWVDIGTSDGLIHVIDAVLIPPAP